jgi:colicin import membrane protein
VRAARYRDPGTSASAVLAIGVHVMLFAVLFFGIRWRTKQPEPVMAELWRELPAVETPRAAPPAPQVVAPKPEPPPPPKVEPKPEPPPPPKVEPKPEPKPDIALEQEKKRKEEADKKKREEEVEKKRREEEAQTRKREEELKAKAEQERKEKELAAQRRREDEAAERKRMQDQLARELASAAPKAAPRAAAPGVPTGDPSALASWQQQIQAKVKSNIVLPPDLVGNPEAVFDVFLLPTGEVQSVKLVKSSGSGVLDDAWERAILKSSPLPRPAKAEVFRRDLRLVFRPRE